MEELGVLRRLKLSAVRLQPGVERYLLHCQSFDRLARVGGLHCLAVLSTNNYIARLDLVGCYLVRGLCIGEIDKSS